MGSACAPTAFSVNWDGKYHDATYLVQGDTVLVIYWGPGGVVRRTVQAEHTQNPEQTARALLSQMIRH